MLWGEDMLIDAHSVEEIEERIGTASAIDNYMVLSQIASDFWSLVYGREKEPPALKLTLDETRSMRSPISRKKECKERWKIL